MNNIRSTLATVWRIAAPYFSSEDKWAGRALLAAVIVLELGAVFLTVQFNRWNNVFYNALQDRNQAVFTYQIAYFCFLATIWVALKVYQLYLNQWLQIRWRRWMTARYLSGWLQNANHYRMQLLGDAADNPDQRIAEDTQRFVEQTLALGIGLLSAVVTLSHSFSSCGDFQRGATAPVRQGHRHSRLSRAGRNGLRVVRDRHHPPDRPAAGRLNFQQQRYEADFRFNLVRVRENAEQISLLQRRAGRANAALCALCDGGARTGSASCSRTKRLTAFTSGYSQAAVIFPTSWWRRRISPKGSSSAVMMQTASAFGSVQEALSVFITDYRTLAEWRSGGGASQWV